MTKCPHEKSLMNPNTMESPYDFYQWMREEAPVFHDPGLNIYIVSRYDLIKEVTANTEAFSNMKAQLNQWEHRPGGLPQEAKDLLSKAIPQIPMLVTADPPQHTRSRALVNLAFSAPKVEKMSDYIQEIIDDLIDTFDGSASVEFMHKFCVPLPVYVISDQLGVSRSEYQRVKAWSDAIVGLRGLMGTDEQIVENAKTLLDFQDYFINKIRERREDGKTYDDMLSDLMNAKLEDERPLSEEEMISVLQQLTVAGNESTTSAICSAMMLLLKQPDLIERLNGDDKLLKRFVEECLRLEAPIQGNLRKTTKPVTVAGVDIPEGAIVQVRHGSGNRDERVFSCPNDIDLDSPKIPTHLTFSAGIHFCIGAMLARKEILLSIKTLLRRLNNLHLTPDMNSFEHIPSMYVRALKELHISFDSVSPRKVAS